MVRILKTLLLPKSLTYKLHPTGDWGSSIQTLSWRKGRDEKYEEGREGDYAHGKVGTIPSCGLSLRAPWSSLT